MIATRRDCARALIEASTRKLLRAAEGKLWRGEIIRDHVNEVLADVQSLTHCALQKSPKKWAPIVKRESWQRCRVVAPGLPYSGRTFWVRGRPVLLEGLGRDVWYGQARVLETPTRYYESNLILHDKLVYVIADIVELSPQFRRMVHPKVLDASFAGPSPDDTDTNDG